VPPDLLYLFATYKVGKNPTAIRSADFNHDGFTDLVTSNISANSLSVLLGNGDGSFQTPVSIRVCKQPRNLTIFDFNHDTHDDLAIACSGSNQVAIFVGQGDGTFNKLAEYLVKGTPVSFANGDFNNDQQMDLAVRVSLIHGVERLRHYVPHYSRWPTPVVHCGQQRQVKRS